MKIQTQRKSVMVQKYLVCTLQSKIFYLMYYFYTVLNSDLEGREERCSVKNCKKEKKKTRRKKKAGDEKKRLGLKFGGEMTYSVSKKIY